MGLFSPFCIGTVVFSHPTVDSAPALQCALADIHQLCGPASGCATGNSFIKKLQKPCKSVQRRQSSSLLSGSSPYKASSFLIAPAAR
jgi:hypothetical protein